jgi:uncharacterized membrane protein YeaQ/YmgE (transglycosylase-associated protein family)
MTIINTALAHLIIILIIGVVAGLVFNRYGQGWFTRNIGGTRHTDITSALVGIAGAFIGFHIGVVLGLLPLPLMQYLLAVVGALIVLWLWRGR